MITMNTLHAAFLAAAKKGDTETLQKLLAENVHTCRNFGTTDNALLWASQIGNAEVVLVLLKNGANVNHLSHHFISTYLTTMDNVSNLAWCARLGNKMLHALSVKQEKPFDLQRFHCARDEYEKLVTKCSSTILCRDLCTYILWYV